MVSWNPWHGCRKVSPGCVNCYMFYLDEKHGQGTIDSERVVRTKQFDVPLRKDRKGNYKVPSGQRLLVNMTSDTFIEDADSWRDEMWAIIRKRPDVKFELITKRIERVKDCLPDDWGEGYRNVMLKVTCENQKMTDKRVPILLELPAKHKGIICCPMLGPVDASPYLATGQIEHLSAGGEFYGGERPLDFDWIRSLVQQSETYKVNFLMGEIGNHFIKDGKHYRNLPIAIQREQGYKAKVNRAYYKIDYGLAGKSNR
ncbi:DUF5131 family protein [Streptococcus merionis]|uniref:DUF5131 family protein n=1 Tax=Streptococcus merionis TaxID=400065 RepID=UPI0035198EBD